MSELERFRDHCRTMGNGAHTAECTTVHTEAKKRWSYFRLFREWPKDWGTRPNGPPKPCAGDCLTDADRMLFSNLADEVDAYLADDSSDDEGLFDTDSARDGGGL